MAKESTSVIILGSERVRWTTLQGSRGRLQVSASGDEPLLQPPTSEGDEETKEADGVVDTVDLLRTLLGKMTGSVTLGMPTDQVLLRVLKLPSAEDEDIPGMVELQVDKLSPFPIENMVVSHELLKRTDTTSTVVVSACQVATVEEQGAFLSRAGIKANRVDVEIMGWWRSLLESGSVNDSGTQVIVLMTGAIPSMIFVDSAVPVAFRSLKGCEGLGDSELGEELAREIEYTLMSREVVEAELDAPVIAIWSQGQPAAEFLEAVKKASGASVTGHDLASLISSSQGMALRASDEGRIDLTPMTWKQEREAENFKRRMIVAGAAAAGAWLLLFVGAFGYLQYEIGKRSKLEYARQAILKPANEVRLLRRRVYMVEAYLDHSQSALECLREVAMAQPPGIDLTMYKYTKGEAVIIGGQGEDVERVLHFKGRLDGVELFPEGKLKGPTKTKTGQKFDITLDLAGEEEI